jgi:hypothetical protein
MTLRVASQRVYIVISLRLSPETFGYTPVECNCYSSSSFERMCHGMKKKSSRSCLDNKIDCNMVNVNRHLYRRSDYNFNLLFNPFD